jgi:hypothetical protein
MDLLITGVVYAGLLTFTFVSMYDEQKATRLVKPEDEDTNPSLEAKEAALRDDSESG